MSKEEITKDIICQILVQEKSKEFIFSVLTEFIPGYEPLNLDYTTKPNDGNHQFKSEDEIITSFIETQDVQQTFYWNKYNDNPHKIMIGADITTDNQIVFSLTFNGTTKKQPNISRDYKVF